MAAARRVVVVGAGVFGVTAAIALRRRGDAVTLIDPGPVPHPLAASTDISKIVRLDYGADETYTAMMEKALHRWRAWNVELGETVFHETGIVFLSLAPMAAGGFEHESFELLSRRGHRLERLDAHEIARRFPAWSTGSFADGYWNPQGGWAASGLVVARLVDEARRAGVEIREGVAVPSVDELNTRADKVIVAAGSWTPFLVPWLAPHLRAVGQPVFHLAPRDPSVFAAARFPVFGADIPHTGYYGFPANDAGIVKVANHGPGRAMHPESAERVVTADEEARFRAFARGAFPALADAPLASTRVCLYCDSPDGHFWIAPDPDRDWLVVAAGDSGHAFKFAPLLGDLIADAVDGVVVPRFRWRTELRDAKGEEASRHR
jgi:glycine/D-amino acid oxidase-like deaminating enzyme